jgi:hypothetical protein
MYKLTSENLSNLGGPMGSEYTTTNWEKYFKTIPAAKAYAEKDYSKSEKRSKIKWTRGDVRGSLTSGDLSWVMYDIEPVKCEK